MVDATKNIARIDALSWEELQVRVVQALDTIPLPEHAVFAHLFQVSWDGFRDVVLSLREKEYDQIAKVRMKIMTLGDFTERDIKEVSTLVSANEFLDKSPKVEYCIIGRILNTRP